MRTTEQPSDFGAAQPKEPPANSGASPGSTTPGHTNPPAQPGTRGGGNGQPNHSLRPAARSPRVA